MPKEENQWTLKKDHERFQIYTRERTDSKISDVQVVALISGTIKEAYEVLTDTGNFTETFRPHIIESGITKKGIDCSSMYLVMDPSFLERRYTYIKLCTTLTAPGSFNFSWTNIPERPSAVGEKDVNMDFRKGSCSFTETTVPDELQVTCQASLDIGGSLPVFMINEINMKAIPSVIWQIYDEIKRRRDFSTELLKKCK